MKNDEIVSVYNRYFKEDLKTLPEEGTSLFNMYVNLTQCSYSPDQQIALGELYNKVYKVIETSSNNKWYQKIYKLFH
jgi:hypothetical protein